MESDWEIEAGGDAPVIDADWAGRIDLGDDPNRAHTLPEAGEFAALAMALARLNSPAVGWSTTKCDAWDLESFDHDEMEASSTARFGRACYIDLVPASSSDWNKPESAIAWCRRVCQRLHAVEARRCRVDLVVRRVAYTKVGASPEWGFGITAYAAGCGEQPAQALDALAQCLCAMVDAVLSEGLPHR